VLCLAKIGSAFEVNEEPVFAWIIAQLAAIRALTQGADFFIKSAEVVFVARHTAVFSGDFKR
jgi:hypothetical protein